MSSTVPFLTTSLLPDMPSLALIGLSPCADLAYRLLANSGRHGVSDLSRVLGVPVKDVRKALGELSDIGAVTTTARSTGSASTGRTWRAVSPVKGAADV